MTLLREVAVSRDPETGRVPRESKKRRERRRVLVHHWLSSPFFLSIFVPCDPLAWMQAELQWYGNVPGDEDAGPVVPNVLFEHVLTLKKKCFFLDICFDRQECSCSGHFANMSVSGQRSILKQDLQFV